MQKNLFIRFTFEEVRVDDDDDDDDDDDNDGIDDYDDDGDDANANGSSWDPSTTFTSFWKRLSN